MMKKEDLITLINTCYDAVMESKAGPVVTTFPTGQKALEHVGFNTFLALINCLVPKNFSNSHEMKKEKEPWEE